MMVPGGTGSSPPGIDKGWHFNARTFHLNPTRLLSTQRACAVPCSVAEQVKNDKCGRVALLSGVDQEHPNELSGTASLNDYSGSVFSTFEKARLSRSAAFATTTKVARRMLNFERLIRCVHGRVRRFFWRLHKTDAKLPQHEFRRPKMFNSGVLTPIQWLLERRMCGCNWGVNKRVTPQGKCELTHSGVSFILLRRT